MGGEKQTTSPNATGGGAGSYIYKKGFEVTPNETINIVVGEGGKGGNATSQTNPENGGATVVGSLVTLAGGRIAATPPNANGEGTQYATGGISSPAQDPSNYVSGGGGNACLGNGGDGGSNYKESGKDGSKGSGGGGGCAYNGSGSSANKTNGGRGGDGYVKIEWGLVALL